MRATQIDEQISKIYSSEKLADGGHEDIVHQRSNDLSERRTNDDADGQIQNTAAHCEIFEFFEHDSSPLRRCEPQMIARRQVFPRADGSVDCPAL
jgi:hypothetical protein